MNISRLAQVKNILLQNTGNSIQTHSSCCSTWIIGIILALVLLEIKKEVKDIECKINNPHYGLKEIKEEVKDIECKINNPHFGLKEIKKEIKDIEHGVVGSVLTTGPVIRSAGVGNLYVKILNNTNQPQEVRITVYDIDECPKQVAGNRIITVPSKCSMLETFNIGPSDLDLEEFEVEIEFLSGATSGIYAYVAGAQGNSFNLEPANVFRHEELVPQVDP